MVNWIREAIAESPTPALFSAPLTPDGDYQPEVEFNVGDKVPEPLAVNCLFTHAKETGVTPEHEATATFAMEDVPAGLKTESQVVTIFEVEYRIAALRRRVYEGVQIGWTLMLAAQ